MTLSCNEAALGMAI